MSEWTVKTLKVHFEAMLAERDVRGQQRFEAQTKAIDAALGAAEKAVTKAENASEKRFEAVNEFRSTLSDQAGTFVTKAELRAGLAMVVSIVIAIGAAIGVAAYFIR